MTYIGTRPTINTGARMVETHLLDFDGDLYGEILTVDLLDRLRGDRSFPTVEAMIDQLRNDEARARALLAAEPRGGGGAKED
jgi:riboflavin kinase/FMN adenylyltransferase